MWLSGLSAGLQTKLSASSIPSQGTCLGCRPGPQEGPSERQPHINVSLPLFLPPFPSLNISKQNLKKKKKKLQIELCIWPGCPILGAQFREHRVMGEGVHSSKITVSPQMSINRRMTNKWLYSDHRTPCSNEKNKLNLYGAHSFNRFIGHLLRTIRFGH